MSRWFEIGGFAAGRPSTPLEEVAEAAQIGVDSSMSCARLNRGRAPCFRVCFGELSTRGNRSSGVTAEARRIEVAD